ncbi:ABC transporter permease [Pseudogracilibacillus sp. SE30717A]|uniref:ABC transporter permease n=1 Tax=Pseudogracilibacillus sp. SE30717A TaxID=3098293 RepID=UPI00300E1600
MNKNIVMFRILDLAPVILLIILLGVFAALDPRIVSGQNLMQILINTAPVAILALGAMVVLIAGGIDLSAGYGVALCSVIFASFLTNEGSLVMAVVFALLTGVLIGLFNGFFIGLFNVQPFIVTLSSMTIIQGATLVVATSGTLMITNPVLKTLGIGTTGVIPNILILTFLLLAIIYVLVYHTNFGLWTYGLGSSAESSESSGVPIARQQILVYLFSGVCTALTAMLLVSRVTIVSPNIGGISILLDAITATVIGGTSIYGGKGSIWGTLVGALIISLITNALVVFGISSSSLDLFKGAIIIGALAIDSGIRYAKSNLSSGGETA